MAGEGTNGVGRLGLMSSIAVSAVLLLAALGAFFYVGFQGKADSDRIDKLEAELQQVRVELRTVADKTQAQALALNEVETQFCEEDNLRNLMHASDMRDYALLYEKVFPDSHWHTDNAFYPHACARDNH